MKKGGTGRRGAERHPGSCSTLQPQDTVGERDYHHLSALELTGSQLVGHDDMCLGFAL